MGDCFLESEQNYRGMTGRDPPACITRPQNIWPEGAPWFRWGLYEYYAAVLPLAMKLIKILALAFDLKESAFDQYFRFPITGLRALHYPSLPPEEEGGNAVGLGAHTDFSWLTMVLQDKVPALEVLNNNGEWIDVPPVPNTLVCNVGQVRRTQFCITHPSKNFLSHGTTLYTAADIPCLCSVSREANEWALYSDRPPRKEQNR